MIVRLTHHQQRSVRHRVPELHARAMKEHRRARGRTLHDVELPPIAWRQILDMMREQCFGPMGGRLDRGVPKSAYSAIKKIAEAVMRIENHPALYDRAVEGWVGDVILGWGLPGERLGGTTPDTGFRLYGPYPNQQAMPVPLVPVHREVHDREVTWWAPRVQPFTDPWSLTPAAHLEFYDWALSQDRASDEPASHPGSPRR